MSKRVQQREETRERIVTAALEAFAEHGYLGASTRDIAARAGTNQGLITYHFRSKEELWRAAADRIFAAVREEFETRRASVAALPPHERAREAIRAYVRFAARHPELFQFMIAEGQSDDERMQWLVETHLRGFYEELVEIGLVAAGPLAPHAYYVMAGAGSLIFAVAPECRRLTGLDPGTDAAIEAHADFVARLLVPSA